MLSRRGFFGVAAGAAAVAAGGAAIAATPTVGVDLAVVGADRTAYWIEGMRRGQDEMLQRLMFGVEGRDFYYLGFNIAADLPVPKRRDEKKPVSQKQFERTLQSPIGKGRLE